MNLLYEKASKDDIEPIYELCKQLIHNYEQLDTIDYPKVMKWVLKKIESSIDEYTTVYADGKKVSYYHFYKMKMHNLKSTIYMCLLNSKTKVLVLKLLKSAVCLQKALLFYMSSSRMKEPFLYIKDLVLRLLKQ